MEKKSHLLLLVIFSSILLLGSNFTPIHSYEYDWMLGEQYLYAVRNYDYEEIRIKNGNYNIDEYLVEYQMNYNITNIDFETKRLDFSYYNTYGGQFFIYNYDFDMDYYSNYFTSLDDFIYIDYIWDSNNETIILRNFAINYYYQPQLFIEPNWTIFNQVWKNIFNESTVVDVVYNPNSENNDVINLKYFSESITSFTFNNKKSLDSGINQLTSSNTELSLHFDLSNVIHESYYDFELARTVYVPIEEYIIDYQFRYSDGGLLEFYSYREEISSTLDDEFYKEIFEFARAYGGLKSLDNPTFIIIPSFLLSVLIMKFSLKKKKEKVINGL